jgi:hypothetical protein
MKYPYLYLFAVSVISLIIVLVTATKNIKFSLNLRDTYYVISLNSVCWGVVYINITAGLLSFGQAYLKANPTITKIHLLGSLLLPLLLILYKTLVWYKEADRSNFFDNPIADFDFEYGNLVVFALVLMFCIMQIIALGNIILATVRTLNLKP